MHRLVFSVLSSFLVNLFILALAANAQSTIDSGLTTIAEEDQLPDGTGDLLRHEFPGWELKWVAEIDFHRTRYSVLYGIRKRNPVSAKILLGTTAEGGTRIIKADTSLFPMNEGLRATPPLEARVAIAQALIEKSAAKYASIQAYVEALRDYDLVRDLAPEQRTAIENLGGRLPPKHHH
jgi:transglutaminase-like putative cysteine protease